MEFNSAKELLELCRKEYCPISEIMRRRECALGERTRDVVDHQMAQALEIMRNSASPALEKPCQINGRAHRRRGKKTLQACC